MSTFVNYFLEPKEGITYVTLQYPGGDSPTMQSHPHTQSKARAKVRDFTSKNTQMGREMLQLTLAYQGPV